MNGATRPGRARPVALRGAELHPGQRQLRGVREHRAEARQRRAVAERQLAVLHLEVGTNDRESLRHPL